MLQVVEVNAIEHLESLRLRWTSLFYQTPGASFFHTLDWLKAYWRQRSDGQRLRVLLVYRGGTLLGILPLVMRQEATAAGSPSPLKVAVLTYPTICASQCSGPIGPNPTATLMASFRHLARQTPDWDLLAVGDIGEHDRGRTVNALELAGFCPRRELRATVSKVSFEGSNALAQRDIELASEITFERIRPLGDMQDDNQSLAEVVDECFALGSKNFTTSASLLCDVVSTASRLGMLDLNLLRLNGHVIAFCLNVHFDGAIQQICAGATASPLDFDAGTAMTQKMLQDSCARKDRCICFADTEGISSFCSTQQLPVVRYECLTTKRLRARLTRFGQWLALR